MPLEHQPWNSRLTCDKTVTPRMGWVLREFANFYERHFSEVHIAAAHAA